LVVPWAHQTGVNAMNRDIETATAFGIFVLALPRTIFINENKTPVEAAVINNDSSVHRQIIVPGKRMTAKRPKFTYKG
jgi:hypothetical protein